MRQKYKKRLDDYQNKNIELQDRLNKYEETFIIERGEDARVLNELT